MSKVEIEHWLEYVKKWTNIIRRAQKMHYKSVLRDSEKNPNKFWEMIKTIFPTKTN